MPAKPLPSTHGVSADPTANAKPLLPTVVVGSYKGGVWKTTIAVALAERLAWAGLRVLLVTSDDQEDARFRLGLKASDPTVAKLPRGEGSVTVLPAHNVHVVDLLYRQGPERRGFGTFDVAVVDTPPELRGGMLPGVLLVATLDGADAARNLITMLRRTPANSSIVLVKVRREDEDEWKENVEAIESVLGRDIQWLQKPLPLATPIRQAHDSGRSIWSLPRRGNTLECLEGIDILASYIWGKSGKRPQWPRMPTPGEATVYIEGWDTE